MFSQIKWNKDGLLPAIAQDYQTKQVLMMAWMNEASLRLTLENKKATYWSRSRSKLWCKGESSGHEQIIHDIRLDCDGDTILLMVDQIGGIACHTGRNHCFFLQPNLETQQWDDVEAVIKSPEEIYKK